MAAQNAIVSGAPGYRLEGAGVESSPEPKENEEVINEIFDLADNDYVFYQNSFVGKGTWTLFEIPPTSYLGLEHRNFISGSENQGGPFAVSIILEGGDYTSLLRSKHGNVRLRSFGPCFCSAPLTGVFRKTFDSAEVFVPCFRSAMGKGPEDSTLLAAVDPSLPVNLFRFFTIFLLSLDYF
jgi:hypothetical protein